MLYSLRRALSLDSVDGGTHNPMVGISNPPRRNHSRSANHRPGDSGESGANPLRRVWLQLWLYVAKHGQRFKRLEAVLCARKTFVSYWFIVSC
jgi:hypothetical protein